MIEINQLEVIRQGKTICSVEQLSVTPGERLGVIGPNGSGKTTLLRVLAGLNTDFNGSCLVQAERLEKNFVHQQPYLFRGSVLENVKYGQQGRVGQLPAAAELLQQLKIEHLIQRNASQLSAGETRRVALARALACSPKLLILDEPLADLDPQATTSVINLLNGLNDTTIIIASPFDLPQELNHRKFELTGTTILAT